MARVIWRRVGALPPPGFEVIAAWAGSAASVPTGYRLCDGSGGTPDLRNSFIEAASYWGGQGPDYSGQATRDRSHSHLAENTTTESAHTHAFAGMDSGAVAGGAGGSSAGTEGTIGDRHSHTVPGFTTSTGSSHGHAMGPLGAPYTSSTNGVGTPSLPPYYALCYIRGLAADLPVGAIVWFKGTYDLALIAATASLATLTASMPASATTTLQASSSSAVPVPFRIVIDRESIIVTNAATTSWTIDRTIDPSPQAVHANGATIAQQQFVLCDGKSDGTPALVNQQFVIGADGTRAVGTTGGSLSVAPGHLHAPGSVSIANDVTHIHAAVEKSPSSSVSDPVTTHIDILANSAIGDPHYHDVAAPVETAASSHGHAATSTGVASMSDTGTIPPAYILAFLQRVAT